MNETKNEIIHSWWNLYDSLANYTHGLPNISDEIRDKHEYFYCQYWILIVLLVHFTFYAQYINESFFRNCYYYIIITIIELTHSKTILEITVKIEPQPAALDF